MIDIDVDKDIYVDVGKDVDVHRHRDLYSDKDRIDR